MSTAARKAKASPGVVVLRRVPFEVFDRLCQEPANRHVRMTYFDGTLELMSPILFEHENWSEILGMIVRALAIEHRLPCKGSGSATFRRAGEAVLKGSGKQPDRSYYLANAPRFFGKKVIDMSAGDPPPDLWIEVDHRGSSKGRLPIYAALRVPEVWRFRVKNQALTFLGLTEDATYKPLERSLSFPTLTPALVREALALGSDGDESEWSLRLRGWAREKFEPRAGP